MIQKGAGVEQTKYALVCEPSENLDGGLKVKDLGPVDLARAGKQHRDYRRALHSILGYNIVTLPPDPTHPDSVFVEDPAVVIKDALVISSLRRRERQGEEGNVFNALKAFFHYITFIEHHGYLEGGDVIVTDRVVYVGISRRTNHRGADQLAGIVRRNFGLPVKKIELPGAFLDRNLHLKGGATFHKIGGSGILLVSEEIVHRFKDDGFELLVTPAKERFGANCISEDGRIIVGSNKPKTKRLLKDRGFEIQEVDISEFEKIDGALTCLSKSFVA
ncbi:MAG: dimethylargininase [Candidatus Liptonbacteria bacterium]|nr:dimethylargininase [Candidatus Liptonbacteria bacterium]